MPNNDQRPVDIPLESDGSVTFREILLALSANPGVGQTVQYHPTNGRVLDDSKNEDVYVGDGSNWLNADDSIWPKAAGFRPRGYAQDSLPSSPPTGTIVHDTNRGLPAWFDEDHYEWPNFVDDVLTSGQTVANTTDRTEVWNPDINAGSLIKGRVYQIDLMGKFSTANTSDQFTVFVDIGGNDVASMQNVAANATDAPWSMEVTFTVREHGETGKIQPHTRGLFDSNSQDEHNAEITIDTTTTTNLSVDIQWGAADPDNTATLGQAHLKQMG